MKSATIWNWEDDFKLEIAAQDSAALDRLLNYYDSRGMASETEQTKALILRNELSTRETNAARLLEVY